MVWLPNIAAIGEVMVELSPASSDESDRDLYTLGFAGDTFNTAVSLARLGLPVAYVTILGDDLFSDQILDLMAEEKIATDLVARLSGRQPGLYTIENAANGERSFRYWRGEAPARELWRDPDRTQVLAQALNSYSHIYLTGITLAIMAPDAREGLFHYLQSYRRRGGVVVFDSNYRARLWKDVDEARAVIEKYLTVTDIALLTIEDEQLLWGDELSALGVIDRHAAGGVPEVVVKQGCESVAVYNGRVDLVDVPVVESIVDTTGAGDAFNAGYLAARLQGSSTVEAVKQGNHTAATVLGVRGGLPSKPL